MNNTRKFEVVFETEDYFVAHVENGGARFGFKGLHCLTVPAGHPLHAEILGLTEETAEAFHDAQIEAGRLSIA